MARGREEPLSQFVDALLGCRCCCDMQMDEPVEVCHCILEAYTAYEALLCGVLRLAGELPWDLAAVKLNMRSSVPDVWLKH